MRSRAERLRVGMEWVLRATAVFALATLLVHSTRPSDVATVERAGADLDDRLPAWTIAPPSEARLALDAVPTERARHWLRALAAAGTAVRWAPVRSLGAPAVVAEPVASPRRPVRIRIGGVGQRVDIADGAGPIDTLSSMAGAVLEVADLAGAVRVTGASFTAVTSPRDSTVLRPVLVVGTAGWEAKFVAAALEEAGWRVAARLRVAPGVDVTQEPLGTIDTVRYSAVIVLDSAASPLAAAIGAFVRSGGGAVLVGGAGRVPALAAIAPGRSGERLPGVAGAVRTDAPRTGLAVFPVASLRGDALPVERRGERVAVAVRRVGPGRAVQVGYEDTWRWRMAAGDDGVVAHREWWSRVVASVAYAPVLAVETEERRDETPVASLVAALGPPAPTGAGDAPRDDGRATAWLFAVLIGALLVEWGSRRLRGAP